MSTTQIFTLSLHDALPILQVRRAISDCRHHREGDRRRAQGAQIHPRRPPRLLRRRGGILARQGAPDRGSDRKSTRLNSSHVSISYAVFCLKKKNVLTYLPS